MDREVTGLVFIFVNPADKIIFIIFTTIKSLGIFKHGKKKLLIVYFLTNTGQGIYICKVCINFRTSFASKYLQKKRENFAIRSIYVNKTIYYLLELNYNSQNKTISSKF